jgi:hypothetical protein
MRLRIYRVSPELVLQGVMRRDDRQTRGMEVWAEGMPADARVVRSRVNDVLDCFELTIESASFPDLGVDEPVPLAPHGAVRFFCERRPDPPPPEPSLKSLLGEPPG